MKFHKDEIWERGNHEIGKSRRLREKDYFPSHKKRLPGIYIIRFSTTCEDDFPLWPCFFVDTGKPDLL